jgi:flagellar biogenesis protein FliO
MTGAAIQMVFALGFVLMLILATAFFYRKKQRAAGLINLVAYHSFGQKIGIAALRVGDEILVLGVTPTDMKLLKKMDGTADIRVEMQAVAASDRLKRLRKIKEAI